MRLRSAPMNRAAGRAGLAMALTLALLALGLAGPRGDAAAPKKDDKPDKAKPKQRSAYKLSQQGPSTSSAPPKK